MSFKWIIMKTCCGSDGCGGSGGGGMFDECFLHFISLSCNATAQDYFKHISCVLAVKQKTMEKQWHTKIKWLAYYLKRRWNFIQNFLIVYTQSNQVLRTSNNNNKNKTKQMNANEQQRKKIIKMTLHGILKCDKNGKIIKIITNIIYENVKWIFTKKNNEKKCVAKMWNQESEYCAEV